MEALTVFYLTLIFISMYMFFFFVILYFNNRKEMFFSPKRKKDYSLSIIVPCYNEEKSIEETINVLLKSDYPGLKKIIIVDDCSKDNSFSIIKRIAKNNPKVLAVQTPKNTGNAAGAKNYGVKFVNTELIGFTDADSSPSKDAMSKMVGFFNDEKVGAVTSAVLLKKKIKFIEKLQAMEYVIMAWTRKLFDFIDSVYVTNGPLSIYRKSIFDEVKGFDEKSMTEDIDITWAILDKGYNTRMCLDAIIYTYAPDNFKVWYRQRERWGIGGIQTIIKFKKSFFKRGKFGFFVMPFVSISILLAIFVFVFSIILAFRSFRSIFYTVSLSNAANVPFIRPEDFFLNPSIIFFFMLILFITGWFYSKFILNIMKEKDPKDQKFWKVFNRLFYVVVYLSLYPVVWFTAIYRMIKGDFNWR
jgi:cellulose synthase/poly-beta-1,6-N-acetylglucosamine synthase-like glycosyltransferase